jgi:hypothetical protein
LAGTDLDEVLIRLCGDGREKTPNDAGIMQEVLAEALARAVIGRGCLGDPHQVGWRRRGEVNVVSRCRVSYPLGA